MTTDFINLSRGIYCPHAEALLKEHTNWVRIQSTQCEQKLWSEILRTLGAQFFMAVSQGAVVVHDCSERPRDTRAMWQGLSWIRYALNRNWFDTEQPEFNRSGANTTGYWRQQYNDLGKSDRNLLRYYRPLESQQTDVKYVVDIESCWEKSL